MKDIAVTKELIEAHGLTDEEYKKILEILGREPTYTELGIFTVMWSEHCSYKSSKVHLRRFPTDAPWVIQGPGENAGVIDIGDGLAVVFKMESHNHPSFIEPYQGAATGVGGILRDIFTMGARPIASLNSLRFGLLDKPKHKYLFGGVVSGIAGYGNCIGVPTVGGEIYFNDTYNGNILVNVFNIGIAKKDKIFKGKATGIDNPVIYVGSKTGRDGIHGASLLASHEFDEKSEEMRPTVQVGDPFTEKLLLEACLELMDKDLIVGIQDMGAAGLTSSSSEMASRAGTGIEIELSLIPTREEGMTPYELMLSESQERMLIVAKKGKEKEVEEIFKKWDLEAVVIGRVTEDGILRVKDKGIVVAEIPSKALAEEGPLYNRPTKRPDSQDEIQRLVLSNIPLPEDYNDVLLKLLGSPTIASKEWVYEQYDHMVRTNTAVLPGSDAAVIRVKGTDKALVIKVDCNSRYCYLDPFLGGALAVAESARNIVCSGGRPLAITDCLNFGNPEKPEVMWQFSEAVDGISEACRRLKIPVVSGNVSFYNETKDQGIYPTPVIGMVGVIDDIEKTMTQWFKRKGDIIVLLGENGEDLGGSEYLYIFHELERGMPPSLDLNKEINIQRLCLQAIKEGIIRSAHDCSEGGLAVALAECCISGSEPIGAEIELEGSDIRTDTLLFGESASRIILSINEERLKDLERLAKDKEIPLSIIGRVDGDRLKIRLTDHGSRFTAIDISVKDLENQWRGSIRRKVEDA
ncbi:MAG: phosphoribosylformylglycinamidine synthase subunit PurL [Nitrospirae bacterium]|nr:phosphoribosylformylglycinamidine synthase subunit PurL [Nitrospirota bacterium]